MVFQFELDCTDYERVGFVVLNQQIAFIPNKDLRAVGSI